MKTTSYLGTFVAAVLLPLNAAELTKEESSFFEEKIRPILADHCYQCHSEAEGKAKGGLTLDTAAATRKGGDSGSAVVPGDVEKSLLHKAVSYGDEDLQMPPKTKGGKLQDSQIALLAQWIKMGAPDPRDQAAKKEKLSGLNDKAKAHWAYQPIKKPEVPKPKNAQWGRTPIDAFILQKLEATGMLPSPDADREALLRRVTYDLTGLPPTYKEVVDFQNDTSPNAWEKVVDRLLASPSYGERQARYWLNTARYSDTVGGERNNRTTEYRYPDAWTYRDYVVNAMNADKPYTDFIIEQIAADKIPGIPEHDPRLAALGFITVGERFRNINDVINDRIDTLSKGFLGITVACARCHDHMFDPVPTRDYYALHGIFASTMEPEEKPLLSNPVTAAQRKEFETKYADMIKDMQASYFRAVEHYLGELQRAPSAYIHAALNSANRRNEKSLEVANEWIKENHLDEQYVRFLQRWITAQNPSVWRPLLAKQSGRFIPRQMSEARMDMMAERMEERMMQVAGDQAGKLAKQLREEFRRPPNPYVTQAFEAKKPTTVDEMVEVYATLIKENAEKSKAMIKAMKTATSSSVPGYEDKALLDLMCGPFEISPAPLVDKDFIQAAMVDWQPRMLGRARVDFTAINLLEISHPGAPAKAMVVGDRNKPVNSRIFIRGQQDVKGEVVPRGFLSILSPGHEPLVFKEGSGRMELAKAIASKENPLTARVAVNRVWMNHFGEGFVPTPDDLGVMSERPSHPELLEYLSTWFMENGWSFKKLHKLITMSRVYQESTHTRPDYEVRDPQNRLLWRANIRRLDFEATRDSLLVYSGQLDRSLGGKPINLTDEPYSYRRSVYGYVDRGNLPELMAHFDFSDPDMANSKRSTTVVPQQALFLMNSPMAVDVTRKVLTRPEIARQPSDYHRITALYQLVFQRRPSANEVKIGSEFVRSESKSADNETVVASRGREQRMNRNQARFAPIKNEGEKVERRPLNAWETYVQALLFSNEAAYVN